jgi:hypothetical protein
LLRKAVHNWIDKLTKDVRKSQMMPDKFALLRLTEATVQQVEELIQTERRIPIYSVTTAIRCFHGLAYSMIHDHLKFRKVCAR